MNYFELFGYTPSPAPDTGDLARRYFELQRTYHPDRFTLAGEDEQQEALRMSAAANEGFAILKDGDKTLAYYLKIKGTLEEEEKYQLPADFLMEMMELNEMAEEDREGFITAADQFAASLQDEVRDVLERSRNAELSEADLQKLKIYHFKKKYLSRILDKLTD